MAMIRFLVVRGASLTAQNAMKLTPVGLARELNHAEALEALERVTEKPFPPSVPLVHLCLEKMVELRWSCPLHKEGVPEVSLFEVQGVDCGSGECVTLGTTSGQSARWKRE